MTGRKNVLILAPYPKGEAASQRFRFEQYLGELEAEGWSITFSSFLTLGAWQRLYNQGSVLGKIVDIMLGCLRRWWVVLGAWRYSLVFIHREAMPLGPPLFEWIIAKIWRKRIIYDFDDAIWLPNTSRQNRLAASIKWHSKVRSICRWAWKVSVGNEFLADFARSAGAKVVVVNPTTIDLDHHKRQISYEQKKVPILGWTGSHSTLKYLALIVPILKDLATEVDFRLVLVADKDPRIPLPHVEFFRWTKETEIDDLLRMDVGLMPLPDEAWTRGKCGFKILQYFSAGIPAVASPVGVNSELIQSGKNGLLADSAEEWKVALKELLLDPKAREHLGKAGFSRLQEGYTVSSNRDNFLSLFD